MNTYNTIESDFPTNRVTSNRSWKKEWERIDFRGEFAQCINSYRTATANCWNKYSQPKPRLAGRIQLKSPYWGTYACANTNSVITANKNNNIPCTYL